MAGSVSRSKFDLQVMWNRLISIVEEQGQVLIRTSFSPIVRESGDISAGIFDLKGRMLAQAVTGTPGHVNTMAESVKHFIRAFPLATMREGDAYICNDPWLGTGHLNDFVVTTPVFLRGRLVALFSCTSHLIDIGGTNGPDGTDVFQEGLYIPMLRLIDKGVVNQTLISMLRSNSRLPIDTEGDTYALAACNDIGARRLVGMMEEFCLENLDELAEYILTTSHEAVVREIAALPRGTWTYSMTTDGYDAPIGIRAALTVSGNGISVDFTGTSDAVPFGINVPLTYTTAYTVFGLGCVVSSRIPNNAGSLAPFSVSAPENCILNAQKPLPVQSRHVLGHMLPDMIFGCLSQIVPDKVPAEGAGCLWNIVVNGVRSETNTPFGLSMVVTGGTGGRYTTDGLSATGFPSGVQGTPIEVVEAQTPLLFRRKELLADSGGDGTHRGGLGQVIEIETIEDAPFILSAAFDRIDHPPRGRAGGRPGAAGFLGLSGGTVLSGKGVHRVMPGQKLILKTPGGGGLGDPSKRARDRIEVDLIEDLCSGNGGEGRRKNEIIG